MKGEILLPKVSSDGVPYLSNNQISTWRKSKTEYFNRYFYKEEFKGNAYTNFGLWTGGMLETGDFSGLSKSDATLMKRIPRLGEYERSIRLDFKDYGFCVIGFVDTNTPDFKHIIDYKSGTENKVEVYENDDYIQLEIYAMALEQESGTLPEKAQVYLYERLGNPFQGDRLSLGEGLWIIDKELTEDRLRVVKEGIVNTALEISKYYKMFLKLNY